MILDFLLFVPLAMLTNSVIPIPFEPVLIFFVDRYGPGHVGLFSAVGSVCAGLAGSVDVRLLRRAGQRVRASGQAAANLHKPWFYGSVLVAAFLPFPYAAVRLALMKGTPRPWLYGIAVALGRFPRYVLMVGAWKALSLPWWASSVFILITLPILFKSFRRPAAQNG